MKIIVFSDSHGNTQKLSDALERNINGLELCIFLGDGTDDIEFALKPYPLLPRITVSGNREEYFRSFLSADVPQREAVFDIFGIKFLAMHGHRPADVKQGITAAASYAASKGAGVLLYGHTHKRDDRTIVTAKGEVRVINPGAASSSYAVLSVKNDGIECCFFDI